MSEFVGNTTPPLNSNAISELRLMTMSEGIPHPSALKKTIENKKGTTSLEVSLSISSHRLASVVENFEISTFTLSVWDWRTGEQLFVREMFVCQWFVNSFDGASLPGTLQPLLSVP